MLRIVVFLTGLISLFASHLPGAQPPNIVFILCDDLGVGDLKAFNPQSKIATPHIDQLAASGMRFSDAHSGSAVCTPTRYGILCGRYAWRTRLQNGVLGGLSPSLVSADQWTVPKLLKQRNYHSACIGKWHLGLDWKIHQGKSVSVNSIETQAQNRNVDYDQPFTGGPLEAGFDEYFGISGSLDMVPYVYLKNDRVTASPTEEKSFGMQHAGDKNQTRLGPAAPGFTAEDVMPRLTKEAIAYLETRAAKPNQPFFLYLPFASPHTPTAPSPEWQGKSGLNAYADFVMQQDDAVGQVLATLDRLKLSENTVVFFTSDNGCSPQADLPTLREKGHDPCWPYRGHKADIFEGGHRVPLVVRWPGMVGRGAHARQTVCLTDFLATAADIAEVDLPEAAGPDSFSILPMLQDEHALPLRNSTVHHSINGSFALRRGNYKLCFCGDSGGWSEPKPDNRNPATGLQLFDLGNDLGETKNIADQHPALVRAMIIEMEQLISRGRSTTGNDLKNDVEVNLWKRSERPKSIDQAAKTRFLSPSPWQVLQRKYYVPQFANAHHPGGPSRGFADVTIRLQTDHAEVTSVEFQVVQAADVSIKVGELVEQAIKPGEDLTCSMRLPAGGWYAVQARLKHAQDELEWITSEPFGVGEVFLVAGQSYATNTNEEKLKVRDPWQRVVAYELANHAWRIAHDPQPVVDQSQFGSIWPALGDMLVTTLDVPVGLVNVAYGGTSSTQWQPGGDLHRQLVTAGKEVGDFRGVLWQQGESDVIENATTAAYIERVLKIRDTAQTEWQLTRPWFLAKSTLHPTVYRRGDGEARIRTAIDQMVAQHGFQYGPDTDLLDTTNRGPVGSRRHFSASGQRHAAAMWFASLMAYLQQPRPNFEAVIEKLPEMHLREAAWSSPVVHRESSVLIQAEPGGPIEARLAFPAAEIISLKSADGSQTFQLGQDCQLSDDRLRLVWLKAPGLEPITTAQMFPPKDAPNSYRHRASNPEQNMFYAPGSYFHLHDLEITYRRADEVDKPDAPTGGLPRTLEKLKNKQPLRIAVSGDSISTGLDASGTTLTPPNQPGYPDLVAAQLASDFGSQIQLTNRAVSGWSVANGVADLDKLLESQPDLLIVAYGMNDVGRKDPDWFLKQSQLIEARAKEKFPEIEIIWVSPMLGHHEWVHTPREMFDKYRDQLKSLVGPHSRLADVTAVWARMLKHKHDFDLTGNGLNHPNDFGHRLYAQAILELLKP